MLAKRTARPWLYAVLGLGLLMVIAPFVWMVLGSFKTEGELRQSPPTWWPETSTLDNYTQLFSRLDFGTYFTNSLVVAVVVTAGNLLFCSMLGYALAMLEVPGKRALFVVVMATLMIPGVVTFVPLFVLVANVGLINSLPGLILQIDVVVLLHERQPRFRFGQGVVPLPDSESHIGDGPVVERKAGDVA